MTEVSVVATFAAVFALLFWILLQRRLTNHRYPLGPPSIPIFGVKNMPQENVAQKYTAWAKKFGSVIYAPTFATSVIVLNSVDDARALLDQKSGVYSNRPFHDSYLSNTGMDWLLSQLSGEPHRKRRAIVQKTLSPQSVIEQRSNQINETVYLLHNLLTNPKEFMKHLDIHAANLVLLAIYGYKIDTLDVTLIKSINEYDHWDEILGEKRKALLNTLPFLNHYPRWLPFSSFRDIMDKMKHAAYSVRDAPFEIAEEKIAKGTALPSLLTRAMSEMTDSNSDEQKAKLALLKDCAGVMFFAGADSTADTLQVFIMAMSMRPEVLKKAQVEVDSAVGTERLPAFEDRAKLQYIEAIMLEVMRWNCVTPTGLPHMASQPDTYNGYTIPKGAVILPNHWAMYRDPEVFPNSDEFDPGRFLGPDAEKARDVMKVIWGWGRRVCPGRYVADAAIFLAIAMLAATFNFSAPSEGNFEARFHPGAFRGPLPFECDIEIRSPRAKELIIEAYNSPL